MAGENYTLSQLVATIPDYLKELVDETMRKRLRLSLLMSRGKILTDQTGRRRLEYPIMVDLPKTIGYVPRSTIGGNYGDHQPLRSISLSWRAMHCYDSMTLWDSKINGSGPGQIVDLFQLKMNNMRKAMQRDFHTVSIQAGDGILPDGFMSFMGYTACTTADKIATPNDTYGDEVASLSTVLGALGGTWDAAIGTPPNAALGNAYPNGTGSELYNANSPTFVNVNTLAWGTGATDWETNCYRVLTQAIDWQMKNGADEGKSTNCMMGSDYFTQLKYNQEAKFRINQGASGTQEARELGFPDAISFDGVAIHTEFDAPQGKAFLENMNMVEICSIWPELFWIFDPNSNKAAFDSHGLDMDTLSLKQLGAFWGQFRYRPRHYTMIGDLTV